MVKRVSAEASDFYATASNEDIERLLGVEPLRVHLVGEPTDRLQVRFLSKFLDSLPQTGGQLVADTSDANAIFFPGEIGKKQSGMWDHKSEFKRGVSGVFIGSVPSIREGTDMTDFTWTALGNAFTQYGLILVGDAESGIIQAAHTISMEGAYPKINFEELGIEAATQEVTQRLTHLAGGAKVTNWEVDRTMPEDEWFYAGAPGQIIAAGRALRDIGLLPDVRLEQYVDAERAREIRLFLEVSGLSIGNLSAWEKGMYVTGSGFNKGDLKLNQIVRIKGFNQTMDGTVVWALPDASRVKPSVETFDQLLVYLAGAFIRVGYLTQPSLEDLLRLAQDEELARGVLEEYGPIDKSIIHLHVQPEKWDRRLFEVAAVNSHLVPKGTHHSSCGTRPLALYTTEALMRATFQHPNKIRVAVLPNHGVFIASPHELPKTVEMLDPEAKHIKFGKVAPI